MLPLLLACTPAQPDLAPQSARPDVVLVSIDTLRADHVSAYGYDRPTTPFLDSLAARGTRFAHARSPSPWTLPTHVTMLTGALPWSHGVVEDDRTLGSEWTSLAQVLDDQGFRTGGFVTSFFVGRTYGLDRGFDRFEDFDLTSKKKSRQATIDAEQVVDAALAFTAESPGEPHFLFLHLYDVHYPYAAPGDWEQRFDRKGTPEDPKYKDYFHFSEHPLSAEALAHEIAQYDEELAYVDDQLRKLADALDAAGREVIWAVTSDHGEEFGERGSWGHGHTLFPEQLHVPWILAGPGVDTGLVTAAVGTQDIAPTLAALVGGSLTAEGLSLVPALQGEPLPARSFPGDSSRFKTNRLGLWQAGQRVDWDAKVDRWTLWADPAETEDLSASKPEALAALQRALGVALPSPWTATPGELRTSGRFVVDGQDRGRTLASTESTAFAVVPVDARVWHGDSGPWSLGTPPRVGDPLTLRASTSGTAALSDEDRARLEALGYIQED